MTTTLPDWLARAAASFPDRLALRFGGEDWSFAELDRRATALARRLGSAGVGPGTRVALLAANCPQYAALVHALTRLGAVLVPLNTRLAERELRWQLADVKASTLIAGARFAGLASGAIRDLPDVPLHHLDDVASSEDGGTGAAGPIGVSALPEADVPLRTEITLDATQAIVYTSGTTGTPKGAILTYGMQWWSAVGSALNLGLRDDDRWLTCLPLFHVGGLTSLFKSVIYGMPVVLHERFDPAIVNASIAADRVTVISVVAVMLQRMLSTLDAAGGDGRYPAHFRCALLGGGPAPRPLLEDCARRGIPVVQTYGLTEACSQAVTLAPADVLRKLGSVGRPLLPVELRIMRDNAPAAPGESGEIELRGPTITPGYADRPDATAAALHDGWLRTGDLGYLDAEGFLYVLDRRGDLIVSGGENVYPAEIEATLLAHPAVAEAGVCGRPDPEWGSVPVAFVRLHEDADTTAAALLEHTSARLARYKVPRAMHLVEQPLPRNAAGKLLRRELPSLLARVPDVSTLASDNGTP